ncbi:LOW QUALITY PROTEIN: cytochrome P450 4C1-like [Thrips palmi]|uniref:LOW QUALITY PROTEIN: cytochrome P450 4C1-like n=1 Tax=Thrips palmi TaxID=161013 RepID=A0A6P8ZBW4_THRPL|nr:LOW QUALITY PROTEIN: cytochrome P450 4C1-like [Thrips palmi]
MAVMTEVLVLAAVAGIAMLLSRFLLGYLRFRKLEMAIPGPPSLPLLGNALDVMRATPDTIFQTILGLVKDCRKLSRVSIFSHMIIVIQDPADIKELMRRPEFGNKAFFLYSLLEGAAKKGLVQLSGAEWKAHRKWLAPGFNQKVLDRFVTIFCEEANGFVDRVDTDKEVDVLDNLRKALMRDFLRTSMAAEGSQFDDDLMEAVEFIKVFTYSVNARAFNPLLWSDQIFALTSLGRKASRMKGSFDLVVKRLIAERRKQLGNQESNHDSERARQTLVDIMLEKTDVGDGKHMTEQDIVDEFKTFMAANVDIDVRAEHGAQGVVLDAGEVQHLAYSEAVSVLGVRDVTCEDLSKLKYLDRVIKEVLRMFPPLPVVARQCYAETELCGNIIPAGCTVGVVIYTAHRDPKYWDKPEVFDPDRFLPENCKDRHPYAYIPFSTGPRNCIGGKYAMMSMATFLATTLRAFKVLPVDDHKDLQSLADNMTFHVTARLVGGVRLKFQARV